MNNQSSSPTPGGPCRKSMPHDGGTQSLYIIYALPRVFREATGKQGFRETFRGASATAVPASTKVLELTSLTKLFLGGFDRCSFGFVYIEFMGNLMTCDFGSPIEKIQWFKMV